MMHSFSAPADICHFLNKFSLLTFSGNAKQLMVLCSDGSGPKKSSPGRAQALNVKLGPGPGLSPSLKAGPWAGPGGLAGLSI